MKSSIGIQKVRLTRDICHGYWSGMILSLYKLFSASLSPYITWWIRNQDEIRVTVPSISYVVTPIYFELQKLKMAVMVQKTLFLLLSALWEILRLVCFMKKIGGLITSLDKLFYCCKEFCLSRRSMPSATPLFLIKVKESCMPSVNECQSDSLIFGANLFIPSCPNRRFEQCK